MAKMSPQICAALITTLGTIVVAIIPLVNLSVFGWGTVDNGEKCSGWFVSCPTRSGCGSYPEGGKYCYAKDDNFSCAVRNSIGERVGVERPINGETWRCTTAGWYKKT